MEKSNKHAEFFAHFPEQVSQEIVDYVTDTVLRNSRYMFIKRVGRKQQGYCTHCRMTSTDFEQALKHNEISECPWCGSSVMVKSSGRGRKYMVDSAYFVWYEKSLVNPDAITARGIFVKRDYRGDYLGTTTEYRTESMYLFEPGRSKQLRSTWSGVWFETESVYPEKTSASCPRYVSESNIAKAVSDTPFQYSMWRYYDDGAEMVRFFDLYSKYPCIEHLTKHGMGSVVEAKLYGHKTHGVVNWHATSIHKVMKMNRKELKDLRFEFTNIDPWLLFFFHQTKSVRSKYPISDLARCKKEYPEYYSSDLRKALQRAPLHRLDAYFAKQIRKSAFFTTKTATLLQWNDYIEDCLKLGLNVYSEAVLFPSDLYRAHQNTIAQIKVKADEALREKIEARNKALRKLRYELNGMFIRPATDQRELINEGKELQHCVGTYANKYARGDCYILVLREKDKPDTPFFTMEVRPDWSIAQCRGFKNCPATPEVEAFIKAFTEARLSKKSETKKNRGVKPAEQRLEVAV